jgi:hypothetical protein
MIPEDFLAGTAGVRVFIPSDKPTAESVISEVTTNKGLENLM